MHVDYFSQVLPTWNQRTPKPGRSTRMTPLDWQPRVWTALSVLSQILEPNSKANRPTNSSKKVVYTVRKKTAPRQQGKLETPNPRESKKRKSSTKSARKLQVTPTCVYSHKNHKKEESQNTRDINHSSYENSSSTHNFNRRHCKWRWFRNSRCKKKRRKRAWNRDRQTDRQTDFQELYINIPLFSHEELGT